MIAHLRGKLLSKKASYVVVEAAGVGYGVSIPVSTFYELGEPGSDTVLHIYTHLREDNLALYGFRTEQEKSLFEKLIGVSGVGPKLAITILSGLESSELIPAIQKGNVERLIHIPGVGRKTAERLILELRDKLSGLVLEEAVARHQAVPAAETSTEEDVLSALTNLGYVRLAAENALREARTENPDGSFEQLLRGSLRVLARKFFK
ncbi:MAG: Holliday junction branch migration protein RuvA [Acidobacteria bacterium]|nr:Holliday junction branch migration protein RuvA [Acidobacteriota bacterium]